MCNENSDKSSPGFLNNTDTFETTQQSVAQKHHRVLYCHYSSSVCSAHFGAARCANTHLVMNVNKAKEMIAVFRSIRSKLKATSIMEEAAQLVEGYKYIQCSPGPQAGLETQL